MIKHEFIREYGKKLDIYNLNNLLDSLAEEEIRYWFAKCKDKNGIRAFAVLFNVGKKNNLSMERKEIDKKILIRSFENLSVND